MTGFRCAAASLERDEPLTGTASTVRAFLLVEHPGPWGTVALRDARMPDHVAADLRERSAAAGVRTLLVRRHGGGGGDGVRVLAAWADAHAPWLETTTLSSLEELKGLDLDALGRGRSLGLRRTDEPFVGVCTHGRHDACCAELGRPTAAALAASHPDLVWEVSHVGGDRFAANLLVLPDGLYYGRVDPEAAPALLDRHLAGHLDPDRLRGRSGYPFDVQVAEVAARRASGDTGLRSVTVRTVLRDGPVSRVRLDVAGTPYDVTVERSTSPERHRLTCQALRESPAPSYDVREVVVANDAE